MKVIRTNSISAITATSEDAGHPVTNLINSSPKKRWTVENTSVSSATVNINMSGTTDSVGIIGVSAGSVIVNISDPNGIVWEDIAWVDVSWENSLDAVDVEYLITDEEQGKYNLWIDFTQFTAVVTLSLYFTKNPLLYPNLLIGAGVVVVGSAETFEDPMFGLEEGLIDFSLSRELSNGAFFYKRRDIVRTFRGALELRRDYDFYRFMHDVARTMGLLPMLWYLVDTLGNKWVIYGRLMEMPVGSHSYPTHSEIEFSIVEVL